MIAKALALTNVVNEMIDLDDIVRLFSEPGTSTEVLNTSLPFTKKDLTAGSESELQTIVSGTKAEVDLPLTIEGSNYYQNLLKRSKRGDTSPKNVSQLEEYLQQPQIQAWENSWVRLPFKHLNAHARREFSLDLLADKSNPSGPDRSDKARFRFKQNDEEWVRFPISYLLKIALVDILGEDTRLPFALLYTAEDLKENFLSDNTSPETVSFYIADSQSEQSLGAAVATETAVRYLASQLLITYANNKFQLTQSGQTAAVYYSPHPPLRQSKLNNIISDSFYRDLFINPCLAGWEKGEEKYRYMQLCHQTLSRSQLNAIAKMKEAGIITKNLIVLPNTSNISLANNGTHISLGSRKLTAMLRDSKSGFTRQHEKYFGDLTIKIIEHFLPLFVGTYTAAPYRIAFENFHPEKVLGFLPHQLDYTHLRMIWRRWKKKASIKVAGQPLTPFGPEMLDRFLGRLLRLKGDYVHDFRIIDYLVTLLSTPSSPTLDGTLGNAIRLKQDLTDQGIFDPSMAVYSLYRLRENIMMGYSGFEGRQYSLFESFNKDIPDATNLQALLTAFAYKEALLGKITHRHIPDSPYLESERRQIFFQAAIGIPTFFVKKNTRNIYLAGIIKRAKNVRASRRYAGYLRIYVRDYCLALLDYLQEEAAELIEDFAMKGTLVRLRQCINEPELSAEHRINRGIMQQLGRHSSLAVSAESYNMAAESYYREELKHKHLNEALDLFQQSIKSLDQRHSHNSFYTNAKKIILKENTLEQIVNNMKKNLSSSEIVLSEIIQAMQLVFLSVHIQKKEKDSKIQ